MALWNNLNDVSRAAEFALTPELMAELDRRSAEHHPSPKSAHPWDEVVSRLRNRQ